MDVTSHELLTAEITFLSHSARVSRVHHLQQGDFGMASCHSTI